MDALPGRPDAARRRTRFVLSSACLAYLSACAAGAPPGVAQAPAAAEGAEAPMAPPSPPADDVQPANELALAADEDEDAPAKKEAAAMEAEAQPGGWAKVRQFPVPDYRKPYDGPRNDFRDTVFWHPSLKTNAQGKAEVEFYLSDAITSFRAIAEGVSSAGLAGRGEALVASKLPVSLAAKLPLEVSRGDLVELPVTVTNTTSRQFIATLDAHFGAAFELAKGSIPSRVALEAGESRTYYYPLKVIGAGRDPREGKIDISVESARLKDALSRVIKVVPRGFLHKQSHANTLRTAAKEELDLPEALPGTLSATLSFFPSPTATLIAGTEAMLAEPTGCFEQASSANYPNVMVLSYLEKQNSPDPGVVSRATDMLDHGYKKLTGYESKEKGYEWFGGSPAHEALTAYGLLEFSDMSRVYKDLDKEMVQRTIGWLKSRRDKKGGYLRDAKALDSFGRASPEVTDAYITYALVEAGERDLGPEIDHVASLSASSKDPYVLALAANVLATAEPKSPRSEDAFRRLLAAQVKDGSFPGADHSITRSGGVALTIETTALAALAMMKRPGESQTPLALALEWMTKQRSSGGFGSTQATVLALKALTRAAESARAMPEGKLMIAVNGKSSRELAIGPQIKDTLVIGDLDKELATGHNLVEVKPLSSGVSLPYELELRYRTLRPATSPKAQIKVAIDAPKSAKAGEPVKYRVTVSSTSKKGLPMAIARIGIPGGLVYQTWQLDELRDKKIIDFYETREREVIVYYRQMEPGAKKRFDLQLLASVPGVYEAPASQAYLYYTDEHRFYAEPLQMKVSR